MTYSDILNLVPILHYKSYSACKKHCSGTWVLLIWWLVWKCIHHHHWRFVWHAKNLWSDFLATIITCTSVLPGDHPSSLNFAFLVCFLHTNVIQLLFGEKNESFSLGVLYFILTGTKSGCDCWCFWDLKTMMLKLSYNNCDTTWNDYYCHFYSQERVWLSPERRLGFLSFSEFEWIFFQKSFFGNSKFTEDPGKNSKLVFYDEYGTGPCLEFE